MAERTGLEPATPGVTGRYSNQLNYRSAAVKTFLEVAERTGLEPATPGVTGRYSNQLNYRSSFQDSVAPSGCPLNAERILRGRLPAVNLFFEDLFRLPEKASDRSIFTIFAPSKASQ